MGVEDATDMLSNQSTVRLALPRSWWGRALAFAAVALIIILAFLFFAIAVGIACMLLMFVAGRAAWLRKHVRPGSVHDALEGEFTRVPRKSDQPRR